MRETSVADQRRLIKEILNKPMLKESVWYILDIRWWNKWERYVDFESSSNNHDALMADYPGELNNSFITQSGSVKNNLLIDSDVTVIPEAAWDLLVHWYGCHHEDVAIFKRKAVVSPGGYVSVELYPPHFYIRDQETSEAYFDATFSKAQTLIDIEKHILLRVKGTSGKEVLFFIGRGNGHFEQISDKLASIDEASLERETDLYIKFVPKLCSTSDRVLPNYVSNSNLPRGTCLNSSIMAPRNTSLVQRLPDNLHSGSVGYANNGLQTGLYSGSLRYGPESSSETNLSYGICGLHNLGNTCFMNSAIQCISNVPPLTHYFLNGSWKNDLNETNPLGMNGRIANVYAKLIWEMWLGNTHVTSPRSFKVEVSRFAPQFSGYAQHDSQELMMFLLDGLHEDLNLITKKPYIEIRDADGRSDEIVAEEAWSTHTQRNSSVIVKFFHGLLKSTVECPNCRFVSVTFDPYASLSLPLPEVHNCIFVVYIWPYSIPVLDQTKFRLDSSSTTSLATPRLERHVVKVPQSCLVQDIVAELVKLRKPEPNCTYWFPDVNNRYHSFLSPESKIPYQNKIPLTAFEYPTGGLILSVYVTDGISTKPYDWTSFLLHLAPNSASGHEVLVTYASLQAAIMMRLRAARFSFPSLPDPNLCDEIMSPIAIGKSLLDSSEDSVLTDDEDSNISTGVVGISNGNVKAMIQPNSSSKSETVTSSSSANFNWPTRKNDAIDSSKRAIITEQYCRLFNISLVSDWNMSLPPKCSTFCNAHPPHIQQPTSLLLAGNYSIVLECVDDDLYRQFSQLRNIRTDPVSLYSGSSMTSLHLSDCFDKFTALERLGMRDLWYCRKCKAEKRATKKFDLWSLPKVLVIHLKRFRSNLRFHDKIDTLVNFPINDLDLSHWVLTRGTHQQDQPHIYDLIAVSNHMGCIGGGHYTAYAKNPVSKNWYVFDDSVVQQIEPKNIVTRAAYVLVYLRRDAQAITDELVNMLTHINVGNVAASSAANAISDCPTSSYCTQTGTCGSMTGFGYKFEKLPKEPPNLLWPLCRLGDGSSSNEDEDESGEESDNRVEEDEDADDEHEEEENNGEIAAVEGRSRLMQRRIDVSSLSHCQDSGYGTITVTPRHNLPLHSAKSTKFPAGPSVKQQLAPTRQHCSTTPCCGTVGTSIVTQLPASVTTANSLLPCPEPFHIEARTWHSSSTISGKLPGSARPVATDGSHQVDPMDFE